MVNYNTYSSTYYTTDILLVGTSTLLPSSEFEGLQQCITKAATRQQAPMAATIPVASKLAGFVA